MIHAIKILLAVAAGWILVLALAAVLAITRWRDERRERRRSKTSARSFSKAPAESILRENPGVSASETSPGLAAH
jgi:hypothetical protein